MTTPKGPVSKWLALGPVERPKDARISSWYEACTQLFRRILYAASQEECWVVRQGLLKSEHWLEDFGKLCIWGDQSGASRAWSSRGSLDHILRKDASLRDEIITSFNIMYDNLERASPIVSRADDRSNVSDDDESMSSLSEGSELAEESGLSELRTHPIQLIHRHLKSNIRFLYRVSRLMRRPLVSNKFLRSIRKYGMNDLDMMMLHYDIQHVLEKIRQWHGIPPVLDQESAVDEQTLTDRRNEETNGSNLHLVLAARLGNANTRRREQFRYWAQNPDRALQKKPRLDTNQSQISVLPTEVAQSPSQLTDVSRLLEVSAFSSPPSQTATEKSGASGVSFSTVAQSVIDDNATVTQIARTVYAATALGENSKALRVPDAPLPSEGSTVSPCPLCYSELDAVILQDRTAWKRHVYRDLRPYVCTFHDCQNPQKLYATRHDWMHHESSHFRQWICTEPCRFSTTSKAAFALHVSKEHPQHVSESQLPIFLDLRERAQDGDAMSTCAFCSQNLTLEALRTHLASHLEEIALFAIPKSLSDTNDDDRDDDPRSDAANRSRNGGLRKSLFACPKCASKYERCAHQLPRYLRRTKYARKLSWRRKSNGSADGADVSPTGARALSAFERHRLPSPLPSRWVKIDEQASIHADNSELQNTMLYRDLSQGEVGTFHSEWPIPSDLDYFYYEITIVSSTENAQMILAGYLTDSSTSGRMLRPDSPGSVSYRSDGIASVRDRNFSLSPSFFAEFGVGDTIGCGIFPKRWEAFMTKNGDRVGNLGLLDVPPMSKLYPYVTLTHQQDRLRVNFGQSDFAYAIPDDIIPESIAKRDLCPKCDVLMEAIKSPSDGGNSLGSMAGPVDFSSIGDGSPQNNTVELQSGGDEPSPTVTSASTTQILHKVDGILYLDKPQWTAPAELNGARVLRSVQQFSDPGLFEGWTVPVLVIRTYSPTRQEHSGFLSSNASEDPRCSEETLRVLDEQSAIEIRDAIAQLPRGANLGKSLDFTEGVNAPYSFYYELRLSLLMLEAASFLKGKTSLAFRCLRDYIESTYRSEYDSADRQFRDGMVSASSLKLLYRHSEILICKHGNLPGLVMSIGWPDVYHMPQRYASEKDTTCRIDMCIWTETAPIKLQRREILFATHFGGDLIPIQDLDVYPLQFGPQSTKSLLRKRQSRFLMWRKPTIVQRNITRLIIDLERQSLRETDQLEMTVAPDTNPEEPLTNDLDCVLKTNSDAVLNAVGQAMLSKLLKDARRGSEQFLFFPPYVLAFNLRSGNWEAVSIDDLREVEWNHTNYGDIFLTPENKTIIEQIFNRHRAAGGMDVEPRDVVLFYGSRGTGKTDAADYLAELLHKPILYSGFSSEPESSWRLELSMKRLERDFSLCKEWGCIMLLQESMLTAHDFDYFLEHKVYLTRFLQLLDDFKGIVIMTTTDDAAVNDEVLSRLTAMIQFSKPDFKERMVLWTHYLERYANLSPSVLTTQDSKEGGKDVISPLRLLAAFEFNAIQIHQIVRSTNEHALTSIAGLSYGLLLKEARNVARRLGMPVEPPPAEKPDPPEEDPGLGLPS